MADWPQQFWGKWFQGKDPSQVKEKDFETLNKNPEFVEEVSDYLSKRRDAEFLVRPKKDRSDTISGAQLTLDNLVGRPAYTPKDLETVSRSLEPPPINADGWLGVPNPDKYPAGTVRLTTQQLEEEVRAGNVISLADLQKLPWEERESWLDQQYQSLEQMHARADELRGDNASRSCQHEERVTSGQAASSRGGQNNKSWEQPKGSTLQEKMSLLTFLLTKGTEDIGVTPTGLPAAPRALTDPRLAAFVIETWMKNFWIRMLDGSRISFFNLFRFVEDNPELEALARRNLGDFRTVGQHADDVEERVRDLPPWELVPHWHKMMLAPDAEARLNFGRVAHRTITTLAPTFFRPDPEPDFSYALFVHEGAAHNVLGDRWGGQQATKVLTDPAYYQDLVEYGPEFGATLMFVAHRELPYEHYKETLSTHVLNHVMKRAPQEVSLQRLQILKDFLDREHLAAGTKLLTPDGERIRQGSNILFNTGPEGQVLVQAISPGMLKEKEYYKLGLVRDAAVARGLLDAFVGPAVAADDPDFMRELGMRALFYINGFKSRNPDDNPHQRLHDTEPPFSSEVLPATVDVFALPPVGLPPFPTVVTHITDAVANKNMLAAFERAARAAWSVEGKDDLPVKRRVAAESAFRRAMDNMGMPVGYLLQHMPDNMFAPEFGPESESGAVDQAVEPLTVNSGATNS